MIAQKNTEEVLTTIDEVKPTKDLCLANTAERAPGQAQFRYESCGLPLRKRKDGSKHCKIHGPMY